MTNKEIQSRKRFSENRIQQEEVKQSPETVKSIVSGFLYKFALNKQRNDKKENKNSTILL